LASNNGQKAVFVVEDGRARLKPVVIGIDDGPWLEVVTGLTGQEDLVVVGKAGLIDDVVVDASPYTLPEGTPSKQKY
jgi:hypothetical protein